MWKTRCVHGSNASVDEWEEAGVIVGRPSVDSSRGRADDTPRVDGPPMGGQTVRVIW